MRAFLSHSSDDKQFARKLASLLEDAGLEVWQDEAALVPGANWVKQVDDAIGEADVFIALVGPRSSSPWVRREIASALSHAARNPKLQIIPVFLPNARIDELAPALAPGLVWICRTHETSTER